MAVAGYRDRVTPCHPAVEGSVSRDVITTTAQTAAWSTRPPGGVGRGRHALAAIAMATYGKATTAATGALRFAISAPTRPSTAAMRSHPRPFGTGSSATATRRPSSGSWTRSWKFGDCHSGMFASPQSPESTYRSG